MSLGMGFLDDEPTAQAAPEESVEQELEPDAELLDDSDSAESDEAQDEAGEQDAIVIDGETVTAEQIKEWKRGTLREQDYSKKTMALAEERKSVEAIKAELNSIRQSLQAGEAEFKKAIMGDLDGIDLKSLRDEDYVEYQKTKELIADRQAKFDAIKEAASKAHQMTIQAEGKKLHDELGWSDKSKSESDIAAFKWLAKEVGIDDSDASSLVSARVMKALIEFAKLKQAAAARPPKGEPKKVAFKSSKTSVTAKSADDTLADLFFK